MTTKPYQNPDATFLNGLLNYGYLMWALVVRSLREASGGAIVGFLKGVLMALGFCLLFYVILNFFGATALAVRGDIMIFILIGVGLFFAMKFTMMASMKALQSGWKLAVHPHLSPVLFVYADSIGIFYNWFLAIILIYIGNGLYTGSFYLREPIMFFPIFFITWLTGLGMGMVLGFLIFFFSWAAILKRILFKVMFFTSGKFTNANILPADVLWVMKWNPLFHLIDQMRGAAFLNYNAGHTNMVYPTIFCFILLFVAHLLYDYMLRRRNIMSD